MWIPITEARTAIRWRGRLGNNRAWANSWWKCKKIWTKTSFTRNTWNYYLVRRRRLLRTRRNNLAAGATCVGWVAAKNICVMLPFSLGLVLSFRHLQRIAIFFAGEIWQSPQKL